MLDKIPTLSYKEVASIPWEGDAGDFDSAICALGGNNSIFKAINPYSENKDLAQYIKTVPKTNKCIVWLYQDEWIAKVFRKGWSPAYGYEVINLDNLSDRPDVIFISYNEPNAETNWQRVLEKAPWAKRVDGVKGIYLAHKKASEISKTDMFYVVDGDAYLADDWTFDFQPDITNRDCVHVWHSYNPINDLKYGYGGVKLFPKEVFKSTSSILSVPVHPLDVMAAVSKKLKVIETVSNVTNFNTDEFSTWRSAFRETVKLLTNIQKIPGDAESAYRLQEWETKGADRPFGQYAIMGVESAKEFFKTASKKDLIKINNREWFMSIFDHIKKDTPKKVIPIKEIKKDTICAVPWMHLNFEPNGKVVPCCLTSVHNYFAGDLNTESIDEIWNSKNMKQMRKEMINGIQPEPCSKCFSREEVTGESGRIYHNRDFPEVLEKIPEITLEDGTCTEMKLKYWDFRFSNLCNFKCRSCGPRYSSAWVPDAKKLGMTDQEKVWNIEAVDDKTNFDFLEDQIDHVQRIYFAGGEPLMMPEHWQILDMLVAKKRFDVKLSYNTNASLLTYQKKNIIDYWSQWQWGKLEIWPSIDELDERAELIRSGTVWHKVEANLKELVKLDNAIIRPGLTIGAWNVHRIPEIVNRLIELGVIRKHPKTKSINYNNFFINLLEHPHHYHVHILPEDYRTGVIDKLNKFISEHNEKYNTDISLHLKHILHELTKPFDYPSAKRFVVTTARVDGVRDEHLYDIIPEMLAVKEAVEHVEKR